MTLQEIMMNIILTILYYLNIIWVYIFNKIGNIYIVYYIIDKNNEIYKENISFNYYTGYNLDKYTSGVFHIKIYNKYGITNIAYDGNISEITKIQVTDPYVNRPKRKNIILQENNKPININLEILDNYRQNMMICRNPISNLKKILKILDINCTNITIIQSMPFLRQTINIDAIDIDLIYF